MLQIVLLIAAIVALVRLPKIQRRTARNYPGVSPDNFKIWHEADIKATIVFVIATWGALALQISILVIGSYLRRAMPDYSENIDTISIISVVVVFLIPLFWPAILGSKAARLKKEMGIGKEVAVDIPKEAESGFSGLAIAGLVCVIFGMIPFLGIVPAIVGLIFAFIALSKIKRSAGKIQGKSMAMTAAIVGGIAVALHIILVILALSADISIRKNSKNIDTLVMIKQIRIGLELYRLDTGNYPQELSVLTINSPEKNAYLIKIPKDAWGRDCIYHPKSSESFELFSVGPDGIPGTKDDVKSDN